MTVVGTIGTTHPLAFAGLTFAALALAADGVRPVCVVAGVTAQDASAVTARVPLDPAAIAAQFAALHAVPIGAFHVGALLSADAVRAVADALGTNPETPVVVDPVLATSSNAPLAGDGVVAALRDVLCARATLITPNIPEAEALLDRPIGDVAAMRDAARAFTQLGARNALITGGHLAGNPVDVLVTSTGEIREFAAERIEMSMRGTGDLLAVTIAAQLARGATLIEAIECARHRVREAIARATPFANTRVAKLP